MYKKDRLRRSMMFVPGNNPGMIRDAHIYGADSIMFDLEDSVAYTEKDAARFLVYNALKTLHFGTKETVVRINDLSSGLGIEDLEAVVRAGVQVVRLPKTDSAQRDADEPVAGLGDLHGVQHAVGALDGGHHAGGAHGDPRLPLNALDLTLTVDDILGAPSCDPYGNANGYSRDDDDGIACGSLGYARTDAKYADNVIIITNHLVAYPNAPWAIPEYDVDYVVLTDDIGDPKGIMSGATRYTKDPKELLIAKTAANVIEATGYLYDGFSMQMGSGGASLATARFLRQKMIDQGIHCRFALGGITGQITAMHEEGLIDRVLDVQSFDLDAALSLKNNHFHHQIGATYYASHMISAAVDQLDFVILSALEIDTDFNVNVLTGSDGVIRGAIGGHPDTAEGASLSVVVAPLTRGRIPTIVKHVNTVVTPGEVVDVVVTEQGIAVNPRRPDLKEKIEAAGLHVFTIEQLQQRAEALVGVPEPIRYKDRIVGVVMYRDNTIIDVVREIDEDA